MARFFKISLFSLIMLALFYDTSGEKEGLAKKVLGQMGNMPGIVGQAFTGLETFMNLYSIFNERDTTLDTNDRLDIFNEKLEQLSSDMKSFENRLNYKLEHARKDDELKKRFDKLFSSINDVDYYYGKFSDYVNDTLVFDEDDMKHLVSNILYADRPLDRILDDMHKAFRSVQVISSNIPTLLKVPSVGQEYMCTLHQSSQQTIHFYYEKIMLTEVKGSALLLYANEYKKATTNKKKNKDKTTSVPERMTSHKNQTLNRSKERMRETYETVKRDMATSSRELWNCDDAGIQEEGIQYARFGPVLQNYVLFEDTAYSDSSFTEESKLKCKGDCERITHAYDKCQKPPCWRHHCYGSVRKCKTVAGDNLKYCQARDGYRRYKYIMYDDTAFGDNSSCENYLHDTDAWLRSGIYLCEECLCTCESNKISIDRYFSLRRVLSDYENNKVIVGARFKLQNNIFHIQIRQGKLSPNGRVEPDDEWNSVDNFSVLDKNVREGNDYYNVTWDTRQILLDDVDSSSSSYKENHVLTGLQFQKVNDQLRLGIFLSEFDFSTGILHGKPNFHAIELGADKRSPIPMDNLNAPNLYQNNKHRSGKNKYVEFTTSDLTEDAGQTTLPFIDIRSVESYPPSPLSGAGILLRADDKEKSGGYLALKVFTLDTVPYMKKLKIGE